MIHDPQINYFGTDVVANIYWIRSEPIIKFVQKFVTLVDKGSISSGKLYATE